MTEPEQTGKPIPIEVSLVEKVKNCTDCQWFWGATPPYGPFPSFDWKQQRFPEAIRQGPPSSEDDRPITWCEVDFTGAKTVEPAILRGCRKAPMMTIGINPNMTAFFAGSKSASWAYPWFSREETYAYYYRHATTFQESISLQALQPGIIPGTEIFAEADGTLQVERCNSHRWMHFTFQYHDRESAVHIERSWQAWQRLVVFSDGSGDEEDQVLNIKKGELIAAQIQPEDEGKTTLYANTVDYYERLKPALQAFSQHLRDDGFSECMLTMGEDVSMHDMVGCASPGWGKNYDIPRSRIADNCVNQNRYMLDQLFQSKPRLVFIVSNSSLKMFAEGFVQAGGSIDLDFDERDIYDLLKDSCIQRHTISWQDAGTTYTSRLIVTPHFSYANNFKQQSRLRMDAWEIFRRQFPDDEQLLKDESRIFIRDGDSFMSIQVSIDDDIKQRISPTAWQLLMDYHYDPYRLITEALITEQREHPLITAATAKHLDRAPGDCSFCVNDKWHFTEGCDYGIA